MANDSTIHPGSIHPNTINPSSGIYSGTIHQNGIPSNNITPHTTSSPNGIPSSQPHRVDMYTTQSTQVPIFGRGHSNIQIVSPIMNNSQILPLNHRYLPPHS